MNSIKELINDCHMGLKPSDIEELIRLLVSILNSLIGTKDTNHILANILVGNWPKQIK